MPSVPRFLAPEQLTATCVAGVLALALALGIGEFAFTPRMPLLIRDPLLPQTAGWCLASANDSDYLAGALAVRSLSVPATRQIQASLLAIAVVTVRTAGSDRIRHARHHRRTVTLEAGPSRSSR